MYISQCIKKYNPGSIQMFQYRKLKKKVVKPPAILPEELVKQKGNATSKAELSGICHAWSVWEHHDRLGPAHTSYTQARAWAQVVGSSPCLLLPPTLLSWCLCCLKMNRTRKQILLKNNHHPKPNNWSKDASAHFLLLLHCVPSRTIPSHPFHQILHSVLSTS